MKKDEQNLNDASRSLLRELETVIASIHSGDRSLAIERLKEAAVGAYPEEKDNMTRAIAAFTNISPGKPVFISVTLNKSSLLAYPGKASGCSTNTVVIN